MSTLASFLPSHISVKRSRVTALTITSCLAPAVWSWGGHSHHRFLLGPVLREGVVNLKCVGLGVCSAVDPWPWPHGPAPSGPFPVVLPPWSCPHGGQVGKTRALGQALPAEAKRSARQSLWGHQSCPYTTQRAPGRWAPTHHATPRSTCAGLHRLHAAPHVLTSIDYKSTRVLTSTDYTPLHMC